MLGYYAGCIKFCSAPLYPGPRACTQLHVAAPKAWKYANNCHQRTTLAIRRTLTHPALRIHSSHRTQTLLRARRHRLHESQTHSPWYVRQLHHTGVVRYAEGRVQRKSLPVQRIRRHGQHGQGNETGHGVGDRSVRRSLCESVVAGRDVFDKWRSGESGAGEGGVRCYEWSVGGGAGCAGCVFEYQVWVDWVDV
jgi:hypothetical protein